MYEMNTERARAELKRLESELSQTPNAAHPICQNAVDQDKCERFADRLEEASNNIDPRKT